MITNLEEEDFFGNGNGNTINYCSNKKLKYCTCYDII